MECDHGDSFPLDFGSNGIPFGSKLKGKLSPQSYYIQFEKKYNILSVCGIKIVSEGRNPIVNEHGMMV